MVAREGASGGIARRFFLVALTLAVIGGPGTAAGTVMADISGPSAQRLIDLAGQRGRLPLIIGLAARADDEVAIERAQQRLLADLGVVTGEDGTLAGPGISGVKIYETIPFIAFTADAAAIQRVIRHPLVISVQEDSALPPG